jgi:hypothetical protein
MSAPTAPRAPGAVRRLLSVVLLSLVVLGAGPAASYGSVPGAIADVLASMVPAGPTGGAGAGDANSTDTNAADQRVAAGAPPSSEATSAPAAPVSTDPVTEPPAASNAAVLADAARRASAPTAEPRPAAGGTALGDRAGSASPAITEADRAMSAAEARRMAVRASISAAGRSFAVPAAAMAGATRFHYEADGRWHAYLDPTAITAAVAAAVADVQPVADGGPLRDRSGRIVGILAASVERIDPAATAARLADAALQLRDGMVAELAVDAAYGPTDVPSASRTDPAVRDASLETVPEMILVGTWTTWYPPGASNGFGANITLPAKAIDGMVVAPGATFEFWRAVGEVSTAVGYKMGGVIQDGVRLSRGALGGGICASATTIFNAAVRAGYQITRRANHTYYLSRYPLGLDATVYRDASGRVGTMAWRNDTPYPVLILTRAHAGMIRVDFYSVPTGRTVTFTDPSIAGLHKAADRIVYTSSLPAGTTKRIAEASDAMRVVVSRTVMQGDAVIHQDTFVSYYRMANGVLQVSSRR